MDEAIVCSLCGIILEEPFIQCVSCPHTNLCALCFSNGAEDDTHESNHPYQVIVSLTLHSQFVLLLWKFN